MQGLYQKLIHIVRLWRNVQSFKQIGTKLCKELRSQELPSVCILRVKND